MLWPDLLPGDCVTAGESQALAAMQRAAVRLCRQRQSLRKMFNYIQGSSSMLCALFSL